MFNPLSVVKCAEHTSHLCTLSVSAWGPAGAAVHPLGTVSAEPWLGATAARRPLFFVFVCGSGPSLLKVDGLATLVDPLSTTVWTPDWIGARVLCYPGSSRPWTALRMFCCGLSCSTSCFYRVCISPCWKAYRRNGRPLTPRAGSVRGALNFSLTSRTPLSTLSTPQVDVTVAGRLLPLGNGFPQRMHTTKLARFPPISGCETLFSLFLSVHTIPRSPSPFLAAIEWGWLPLLKGSLPKPGLHALPYRPLAAHRKTAAGHPVQFQPGASRIPPSLSPC